MNEDTIQNSIMYICVASVFLTWSITSYYEDIKEQDVLLEAFKNGYIQCVENNFVNASFAKVVWKKECPKIEDILTTMKKLQLEK